MNLQRRKNFNYVINKIRNRTYKFIDTGVNNSIFTQKIETEEISQKPSVNDSLFRIKIEEEIFGGNKLNSVSGSFNLFLHTPLVSPYFIYAVSLLQKL